MRLWRRRQSCPRLLCAEPPTLGRCPVAPQIVSGSRDKTIKLWNTLGECKYTIESQPEGHSEWVSCVRFSPVAQNPVIVSAGWDKLVKVRRRRRRRGLKRGDRLRASHLFNIEGGF